MPFLDELRSSRFGDEIDACGDVIFSPSSWEPQEEGMMSIAARFFPQLRNQGMSVRRGRSQTTEGDADWPNNTPTRAPFMTLVDSSSTGSNAEPAHNTTKYFAPNLR
jgi:hypothetical protein